MTESEYNRLKQADNIQNDIHLLRDAIAVLRKHPIQYSGMLADKSEIVRLAVNRFVKDEDILSILMQKLDALELKFSEI